MPAPQPDVSPAATRGNLLDNIRVQHGPVDVIRRFLRLGEQEALRRGISLSFATFDELLAVNEQNTDSWRPLVGVFDPRLNMLEPSSSYCILGRNELGEVVSAQAARLYDWRLTNFHDEATSLRFIYKSPEQDKRPGENITVTAKVAKGLGGRVVFSGAGWYRRDHRNTGLSTVLPRVARAYTFLCRSRGGKRVSDLARPAPSLARDVASATVHVKDQYPAEGILGTAKKAGCDLIVMASHGRRGLGRLLLRNDAVKALTHSTVPVLICR
jgi:hypothetical protein